MLQVLHEGADAGSMQRYYSLPSTLSLPPMGFSDAPLLLSSTSLLPGAWSSGLFGDAMDEVLLDSPVTLQHSFSRFEAQIISHVHNRALGSPLMVRTQVDLD